MYFVLSMVLAVALYHLHSQLWLLLLIVFACVLYAIKLHRGDFPFQQPRQWQIKNNGLYKTSHPSLKVQTDQVLVHHLQVWRSLVLFSYCLNGKHHKEIIVQDAVDPEAFRQFRCMIKQLH